MSLDEESIRQAVLGTVGKCAACGRRFRREDIRIVGHQAQMWFLLVGCDECHNEGLMVASFLEDGPPPASDLARRERESLLKERQVGNEDVAEMATFLQKFDGDFARLFGGQN